MSAYGIDGNILSRAYNKSGAPVGTVYDVNGTAIPVTDFADSTTVTNIYTSSITSAPQGGCIDNDGNIYICLYAAGKFLKYNIGTGTLTQYSFTPEAYGHANGMAYNPNTDKLYIASMNNTGEVFVLDKSCNLVDTLYARDDLGNIFTCWNIAYDQTNGRFITTYGDKILFMNDNFEYVSHVAYDEAEWANTRQDIETDGVYIYCLSYNANHIYVFDMQGNLVKDISNTAFSGEPESMCYDWTNDKYYIEGKSSYVVIREAVFKN